MQAILGIDDWAAAICALPRVQPLARRLVVVPNERVAHALRRRIIERGAQPALSGTLFTHVATLAAETLSLADVAFAPGEESLRRARLVALLEGPLQLRYFDQAFLRTTPGWADALTRTIDDLEGAGLAPEQLGAHGGPASDIATLWAALDAAAGSSWTLQRILIEAARWLQPEPQRWQLGNATLAAVTGHESAAHARFLCAIPGVQIAPILARPLRSAHLARIARLFGDATRDALTTTPVPQEHATDRDRLARGFFEPPSAPAPGTPPRPRDGSADLEEYAGIEAEVEAAVDWLTREVLEHHTPLCQLAILSPRAEPYTSLLLERIARLPAFQGDAAPVLVANGVPVASHADGARLLCLLGTLRDALGIDSLAELLPYLRTEGEVRLHQGSATQLLQGLGTLGGSPADPHRALDWVARAEARSRAIAAHLESHRPSTDEDSGIYERKTMQERADALRAVLPGLRRLCGLAEHMLRAAPLSELWPALMSFANDHLRTTQGPRVLHLLDGILSPLCSAPPIGEQCGKDALALIEITLRNLRIPLGRYGEPRLYIGTVQSAVGLPFTSVRVLGMSEGQLPSSPREDPVLSDALRHAIAPDLPTSGDTLRKQLHALDRVVRATTHRVSFSTPRLGAERSNREPSAVFVEAAVAIGRSAHVPSRHVFERDYFIPARRSLRTHRLAAPLLASATLERQALLAQPDPAGPNAPHGALSATRIRTLVSLATPGPFDGLLGADLPAKRIPGLDPERPISASKLKMLLECPFRFMLVSLLGWREPAESLDSTQLDALTYGSLMHRVVELFSNQHGNAFAARETKLDDFHRLASEVAVSEYDALLQEYPLASRSSVEQQRKRLLRDLNRFLDYDWDDGRPRQFVAAEKAFGWSTPFAIDVGGEPLYLRGAIDRLDIRDGRVLLRDLKTGKPKPRRAGDAPDPLEDLQIGIYGLVARAHATPWQLPPELDAAYVYPRASTDPERAFYGQEYRQLEAATRRWLAVAADLLRARAFPRTPRERDCQYCSFKPVCGQDAPERAAEVIEAGPDILTAFGKLKAEGS